MPTDLLLDYLNAQRRHVLGILEGLDSEALRRPVLPSGWSCLGLVKHLTLDEERFWFRAVVGADPEAIAELDELRDTTWHVPEEVAAESVLADYRAEIARSDAIITTTPMDSAPAWWPEELFGDWRIDTVGEVVLHMIAEVACHAGHLDAARELLDGRQWLVLT